MRFTHIRARHFHTSQGTKARCKHPLKTIIHKVLTAVRLLVKNPGDFARTLQDRLKRRRILAQLRQGLQSSGGKVIFRPCGTLLLPFHDDGDLQELLYHVYGTDWEAAEKAILTRFLKPGDCFVDVGTNMGFITTIASRLVGAQGAVHSFEPSPVVHQKLLGVIKENGLKNVTTHNVGCGEAEGEMTLSSPNESSGNATLTLVEAASSSQKVTIVRLDDYLLPRLQRLDFLKIDTEGFEDHVLAGAGRLIDTFHPTIYIELAEEYFDSSQKAIEWLRRHEYVFEEEPDLGKAKNGDNFIVVHKSKLPVNIQR